MTYCITVYLHLSTKMPSLCNTLMPSGSAVKDIVRISGLKSCSMAINISKLNLPPFLRFVMMYSLVALHQKSTLGSVDMARSVTCLPKYLEFIEQRLQPRSQGPLSAFSRQREDPGNEVAKIGASNHDTSSMPTVHCALFKMAAVGISKRLKGSSLENDKKNQFAR